MWIKHILSGSGSLIALLLLSGTVQAQLSISLEGQRDTFLLYEPIEFTLNAQNTTSSPIALQDHPITKRPWLTFQIFRANGEKVGTTGKYSVPPQVLRPGEAQSVQVNITPLYRIRDTGPYDIRASVSIPGGATFQTSRIRFYVGKGEEAWSKEVTLDGVLRKYSLIRFLENENSSIYFRVEEPQKNLVYTTTRLGTMAGFTKPEVKFDLGKKIHVLHVSSSQLYRYTRLGPDGQLEYQEDRQIAGGKPTLVQANTGEIQLAGGVDVRKKENRRKLSEDQMGL